MEPQDDPPRVEAACRLGSVLLAIYPKEFSRLLLPSEIEGQLNSKAKCNAVHDLVHALRNALEIPHEDRERLPADYIRLIDQLSELPIPEGVQSQIAAIDLMSTPEGYARIRQGNRMRINWPRLEKGELQRCAKEVKVAMIWAALHRLKIRNAMAS